MVFERFLFRKYLNRDENLLFVVHPHWMIIQWQMIKIGLLGYLTPLLMMIFFTGFSSPLSYFFYLWLFISMCYSTYSFFDWYLDAWLFTDVSVIDTTWDGFFKQKSSRVEYNAVEAINIEMTGFNQKMFNYGNLYLIRASGNNLLMEYVPDPQFAASQIHKIQSKMAEARAAQNAESVKDLLAEVIQEHIRVKSS